MKKGAVVALDPITLQHRATYTSAAEAHRVLQVSRQMVSQALQEGILCRGCLLMYQDVYEFNFGGQNATPASAN